MTKALRSLGGSVSGFASPFIILSERDNGEAKTKNPRPSVRLQLDYHNDVFHHTKNPVVLLFRQ